MITFWLRKVTTLTKPPLHIQNKVISAVGIFLIVEPLAGFSIMGEVQKIVKGKRESDLQKKII